MMQMDTKNTQNKEIFSCRNRMIPNPVYDPGDATIEENTHENNGENAGYSEIKDIIVRITCTL